MYLLTKKRNELLLEIKNDLKAYYAQKIDIDREKLEIEKKVRGATKMHNYPARTFNRD